MTSASAPTSNPKGAQFTVGRILDVSFSLFLNVASSCGTIFVNKLIFKSYGFTFGTTLTVCHFIVTFLLLLCCVYFGLFEFKRLPMTKVLPISFAFCGYVVFNNISLLYNSVSFYQVMKILCTPVIIAIESVFYGKYTDNRVKLSLIPVCLGIFITVATDFEVNLIGTVFALVAVVSNSLYTIYGKTKQSELQANAMQILLYQSIQSAVILLFCIPIFDDTSKLLAYKFDTDSMTWILVSCFTAFAVNLSFFLLVGKTSPLTVNVVGYLKTCIVFIGGFLFFDTVVDMKNIIGISLTLLGVLAYTYVKIEEDKQRQASAAKDAPTAAVQQRV
jgi:solute carrier family 35 protein E3